MDVDFGPEFGNASVFELFDRDSLEFDFFTGWRDSEERPQVGRSGCPANGDAVLFAKEVIKGGVAIGEGFMEGDGVSSNTLWAFGRTRQVADELRRENLIDDVEVLLVPELVEVTVGNRLVHFQGGGGHRLEVSEINHVINETFFLSGFGIVKDEDNFLMYVEDRYISTHLGIGLALKRITSTKVVGCLMFCPKSIGGFLSSFDS